MNIFQFHPDIFRQLLCAKLVNIRSTLTEKIINIYVWAGCTLFVMSYLMQSFGLAQNFGQFQLAGILSVVGLFELYGNTATLVADLEGDRIIAYYLTLPTSMLTVLLSYICYYVIMSMSMSIALLPLGKLLLWNQFHLIDVAWLKFGLFMMLINLVWAALAFVLAAYLSSLDKLSMAWCRVIFPLWFLGGFQFSWMTTHATAPMLAYVMLLNPVIYATEGIRAVMLGQDGYLSFWLCFIVMVAVLAIAGAWAFVAMKKRLDLV
jgi:ABC-2 type transport system permease protein